MNWLEGLFGFLDGLLGSAIFNIRLAKVDRTVTPFDLSAFDNSCHLAKRDRLTIAIFDNDSLKFVDGLKAPQSANQIFIRSLFIEIASGRIGVTHCQGFFDLVNRHSVLE